MNTKEKESLIPSSSRDAVENFETAVDKLETAVEGCCGHIDRVKKNGGLRKLLKELKATSSPSLDLDSKNL